MDFVSRFLRIFHTTFSNMRPSFHNKPSAFTRFFPNRTVSKSKVTCFSWLYISLLLHNRLCIVCNICEDLQRNFDGGCSGLTSVLLTPFCVTRTSRFKEMWDLLKTSNLTITKSWEFLGCLSKEYFCFS